MNVPREVILDLLPVYLAGEASPATRALVEEYLAQDPELAARVRAQAAAPAVGRTLTPGLPPELALQALRRTRRLLGVQRWLFALAITFTAIALTSEFQFRDGRITEFHFLIRDYPLQFGACFLFGAACWLAYVALRRRLKT